MAAIFSTLTRVQGKRIHQKSAMSTPRSKSHTSNYASTANIEEVTKFYNSGDKTFETDFSSNNVGPSQKMRSFTPSTCFNVKQTGNEEEIKHLWQQFFQHWPGDKGKEFTKNQQWAPPVLKVTLRIMPLLQILRKLRSFIIQVTKRLKQILVPTMLAPPKKWGLLPPSTCFNVKPTGNEEEIKHFWQQFFQHCSGDKGKEFTKIQQWAPPFQKSHFELCLYCKYWGSYEVFESTINLS